MKKVTRVLIILSCALLLYLRMEIPVQAEWYRGTLHTHSQWSDGKPFPEWALNWYKTKGYNFVCLSDHNIFQTDELQFDAWHYNGQVKDTTAFKGESSRWKYVNEKGGWPHLTSDSVTQNESVFKANSMKKIEYDGRIYYRLKTFDELSKQFNEPGIFLLIPGFEQTGSAKNGCQVHMNFINVRNYFPYIEKATPLETIRATMEEGKKFFKESPCGPYMFTLNHPIWRWYDISPEDLLALPEIRYYELNNAGLSFPGHEEGWEPEKFWDVVNAFRCVRGQQLLLVTGTDDEHSYSSNTPRAWTMINAKNLSWNALYDAICHSDFYTSNGLFYDRIHFDSVKKTLTVKIQARPNVHYRIDFIGTKADFDQTHHIINSPKTEKSPERKIDVYSDDIGIVLKTIDGTEGSYTLTNDDLYVRARITTVPGELKQDNLLLAPAAWTQPYRAF